MIFSFENFHKRKKSSLQIIQGKIYVYKPTRDRIPAFKEFYRLKTQ